MDALSVGDRLGALLAPAARSLAITLTREQVGALGCYAERLLDWNRRINLTGARDLETVAHEHIADALALVAHLPAAGRCVDVGSGAGLPGIVLGIMRPDLAVTLLEPNLKKRSFLAAIVRELGLERVEVRADRLEEHVRDHWELYDFAVARAVFSLSEWLAAGARLVRPGGRVAGLAGGDPGDLPDGVEIHRYDVGAGPRTIVLVRK